MKQQQYEAISEDIDRLEEEKDSLIQVKNEISAETEKIVNEAVDKVAESEMQKEFLNLASDDNPKSVIGKMVSEAFKKFKDWWVKSRGPKVVDKTKTSVMERLMEARRIADEQNAQRRRTHKEHGQER